MKEPIIGDTKIVFNAKKWDNRDVDNNEEFWEEAVIHRVYRDGRGDILADVKWFSDDTITTGHFVNAMR